MFSNIYEIFQKALGVTLHWNVYKIQIKVSLTRNPNPNSFSTKTNSSSSGFDPVADGELFYHVHMHLEHISNLA